MIQTPPPRFKLKPFQLTEIQLAAMEVVSGDATHAMLYGGSRSGKTFLHVRNVVLRALKAGLSRHLVLRLRFNHVKSAVIMDTFPKVMQLCFPDVPFTLSRTDWFAQFPNGSQIWFGGLDDKERTEKILGQEYVTIFLNEASQISNDARETATTRLAQKVHMPDGSLMKPRMFYDCNPTNKLHWTYKMFIQKVNPVTKIGLPDPQNYVYLKMNPEDNLENLSSEYLKTLESLSAAKQKRFLKGEFSDATPNALFNDICIDTWRVTDGSVPAFVRIVVGVDPSGAGDTENSGNDAIGIVVGGLGVDGNAYLVEDATVLAGPAVWGRVATGAFDRHEGDVVVGETNYGGDMVRFVIQTARPGTPFKKVTASRGKHVRAEPFSALYEQGKVRHVGEFTELEEEITHFSTTGYVGTGSPNRADAWFWVLAELFPSLVKPRRGDKPVEEDEEYADAQDWMG